MPSNKNKSNNVALATNYKTCVINNKKKTFILHINTIEVKIIH